MTFKVNDEYKDLMEFHSDNSNLYMNETSDNHLVISPIKASSMTIQYKDFRGKIHVIEGILSMFVSDYKSETK